MSPSRANNLAMLSVVLCKMLLPRSRPRRRKCKFPVTFNTRLSRRATATSELIGQRARMRKKTKQDNDAFLRRMTQAHSGKKLSVLLLLTLMYTCVKEQQQQQQWQSPSGTKKSHSITHWQSLPRTHTHTHTTWQDAHSHDVLGRTTSSRRLTTVCGTVSTHAALPQSCFFVTIFNTYTRDCEAYLSHITSKTFKRYYVIFVDVCRSALFSAADICNLCAIFQQCYRVCIGAKKIRPSDD